jgi:ketosteroid isomerase-like protein
MVALKELTMSANLLHPSLAARAVLCAALSVGATGAWAAGPSTQPETQNRQPSRCSTAVEDRNLANFQAYLAALTNGDFNTALAYFAPEAVVVAYGSVPFAGTWSATDGTWANLQQQYWDFSNSGAVEAPVLHADCDKVILNGQFKRVARATGRTVDVRVIEYFTFNREGKMVRDDFYLADTAAVNAVLAP